MRLTWQSKMRVRVHDLPGRRLEPVGKLHFGLALGLAEVVAKALVVGQRLELAQLTEVGDPAVADGLGDGAGERRVGQQQPAPRRDAVGLVVEPLGKHLGQVLDRHRAQQPGVNGGHAVGAVRADDGEVGHADLACRALLDQAHAGETAFVAGEARADLVEQAAVDLVDDLQMARQQVLEPGKRPFLQRLGQQRVVRVGECSLREVPGLVPAEVRVVEQNPHQLGNGHRRVRVVELDGDFLGKRAPVGVAAPEAAHEIGQRAGDQEILLQEPQPLASCCGVVGIQHARQRFGRERLGQRAAKSPPLNR